MLNIHTNILPIIRSNNPLNLLHQLWIEPDSAYVLSCSSGLPEGRHSNVLSFFFSFCWPWYHLLSYALMDVCQVRSLCPKSNHVQLFTNSIV